MGKGKSCLLNALTQQKFKGVKNFTAGGGRKSVTDGVIPKLLNLRENIWIISN